MSVLLSFLYMFICKLLLFLNTVWSRKLILLDSSFVMLKDKFLCMLLLLVINFSSCIFCVFTWMMMSSTYLL